MAIGNIPVTWLVKLIVPDKDDVGIDVDAVNPFAPLPLIKPFSVDEKLNVPDVVTGDPLTVKPVGADNATLVTEPPPDVLDNVIVPPKATFPPPVSPDPAEMVIELLAN